MKKFIFFALTLTLSGMAYANQDNDLIGLNIARSGISFQVWSGGCTTKDNYKFKVSKRAPEMSHGEIMDQTSEIEFFLVQKDKCESFPELKTIQYSFEELGLNPAYSLVIKNKIFLSMD